LISRKKFASCGKVTSLFLTVNAQCAKIRPAAFLTKGRKLFEDVFCEITSGRYQISAIRNQESQARELFEDVFSRMAGSGITHHESIRNSVLYQMVFVESVAHPCFLLSDPRYHDQLGTHPESYN
jgi:hypothetical protein